MAWDDATSKTLLETGPVAPRSFEPLDVDDIPFSFESDSTAWSFRTFIAWEATLEPLWVAEWDFGPSQVVSSDAVAAYNNGFNNGLAIGVNIKH